MSKGWVLSPRELEVLKLLADGLSNSAIASALVISELTVGRHVGAIYLGLGLSGFPQDGSYSRRVRAALIYRGLVEVES